MNTEITPSATEQRTPVAQGTLPKLLQRRVLIVVFLLTVLTLLVTGVLVAVSVFRTQKAQNISQSPSPSQTPLVDLTAEYQNPFEKKEGYKNPFESYENPFEKLE